MPVCVPVAACTEQTFTYVITAGPCQYVPVAACTGQTSTVIFGHMCIFMMGSSMQDGLA